jgi:hypothetical protein
MRTKINLALAVVAVAMAGGDVAHAGPLHAQARTAVAAPDASPSAGLSRPGLAWSAGLPYPPDQFGAIGPEHYVQGVTNTGVAVFRRSDLGIAAGPVAAGTFAAAPAGAEVVDTQMMWDRQTSRWYYAFAYKRWVNNTRTAGLLYGWSKTADPTDLASGWCRMRIANGSDFDDRPKLGDNRTHLIIATNADPWSGSDFDRVWTMPKPDDGDTSCPASQAGLKVFGTVTEPLRTSDGDVADSAIVAQDNDGAANGWIVAADDRAATSEQIMLWHVDSNGDLFADGNIAVAPFGAPPAAPQPSPNQPLDPVDERLNSAVADMDPDAGATAVWTSHTIADPAGSGRSVVRWYEIVPSACAPVTNGLCPSAARRQQGEVKDSSNWLFNAAMAPTDSGNEAVLHYDSASPFQLVQVRARARGPGTELGSLGDEVTVDSSDAAYDEPTCHDARPYCRWGDYSAATTDPLDPHTVWGSNQAIGPVNAGKPHWKTRNFALSPGASPVPDAGGNIPAPPGTGDPGDGGSGDPGGDPVPPVEPPVPRAPGDITVMSRNLDGGARPEPRARMKLVAREILKARPDLVGLQEVGARLADLRKELGRLGARYRLVAHGRRDGGLAVLAGRGVRVSNVRSHRGSNQLDASIGGRRVHFVNARIRRARARLYGALDPRGAPTVVVGDIGRAHRRLAASGFREARTREANCCFAHGLRGGSWNRIAGHLMTRPRLTVVLSFVTGFRARTPGGRAASDQGGVVSVLRGRG